MTPEVANPPDSSISRFQPADLVLLLAILFGAAIVATPFVCLELRCSKGGSDLIYQLLFALSSVAALTVVRPIRECLRNQMGALPHGMLMRDILLSGGLIFAWGGGVHSLLVTYPDVAINGVDAMRRWNYGHAPATGRFFEYLLLFVASVVVAPIAEEIIFRGALLRIWLARTAIWRAVLLSSLVFALAHSHKVLFAFVGGIVFALMAIRYGSLWPGIMAHMLANFLTTYPVLGQLILVKDPQDPTALGQWTWEMVFALVSIPLAVVFWRRFRPG